MNKTTFYKTTLIIIMLSTYLLTGLMTSKKSYAFSTSYNTSINPEKGITLSKFKYVHRFATEYYIEDKILEDLYFALSDRGLLQDNFSVLMGATIAIESKWDRFALAPSGYDVGLFQLNYRTRKSICNIESRYPKNKYKTSKINIEDFDIETNLNCYIKVNNKMKMYYKFTKNRKFRYIKINNKLNNKYFYAHHVWYNPKRQLRIDKIEHYIHRYNKGELLYDLGSPLSVKGLRYKEKRRVFRLCKNKCREKHFTKNDFDVSNRVEKTKLTGGRYEKSIREYISHTFRYIYRGATII